MLIPDPLKTLSPTNPIWVTSSLEGARMMACTYRCVSEEPIDAFDLVEANLHRLASGDFAGGETLLEFGNGELVEHGKFLTQRRRDAETRKIKTTLCLCASAPLR